MIDLIVIFLAGISVGAGLTKLYYLWMYAPLFGYMRASKECRRHEE
jgi:hypothetical protein